MWVIFWPHYFQILGCVFLLKSKTRFLIRKRIFRFFTKTPKRIIDPNDIIDPQRRWIPWIISKLGYFEYMIRSVSLLRIRQEWIQQLFDNTTHLHGHLSTRAMVNDLFYPFYPDSKIAIQTGSIVHEGKSRQMKLLIIFACESGNI